MLVLLQLPQLALPMFIWFVAGVAISIFIAARKAKHAAAPLPPAERVVQGIPHPPIAVPSANDTDLMNQFNISFDGRQYEFNGYRYDRLSDAVSYARLVTTRNA
jgi:hypothetical protein